MGEEQMAWVVGVDVGGTFTDFYAFNDSTGTFVVHKTPSTPTHPAQAIVDGLQALCTAHSIDLGSIARVSHGTTVATNTLLQRRGATVGLITTQGFRDLLEIGRQTRPHMFSLQEDHPAPVVPRERRFEVAERVIASGDILRPLDTASLAAAVAQVRESGAEACAVCLLFAFVNPTHERAIAEALETIPGLYVSLSSEVQPEFREYERLSTTVLNAYLQPIIARYLHHLQSEVTGILPATALGISQSSGGLMSLEQAQRFPIRTALSGPAAGAVGAIHVARLAGRPDVITLDMGGTSADVALVRNYQTGTGYDRQVGGFPVRLPMVDINTVGAGGGSIAWFDRDGLLKVGPLSAGASPGPACYRLGGEQPTVTDANLLLGRLAPSGLLGGTLPLDIEAARTAFVPMATRLGFTVERTAHGVLGVVASNMVRAIRAISVERGHDPRHCALMPFGGAGPLHASDVARSLSIREIIVPLAPGILCAQGLVVSDLKEDFVRTARTRVDEGHMAQLQEHIGALTRAAIAWCEAEKLVTDQRTFQVTLDMRYVGQNFELSVPLDTTLLASLHQLEAPVRLRALFFTAHEMHYGYHNPDDPVEIMNYRLTASGHLSRLSGMTASAAMAVEAPRPVGQRSIHFTADTAVMTPVFARAALVPGHTLTGPAVIDQLDATTLIYPGDTMRVDDVRNLIIVVQQ
jgi:N-methylhydantoinase A